MNRFFAEKCTIGVAGRTPESYETLSNTLIFMMQDKNHENVIFGAKNDVSRLRSHEYEILKIDFRKIYLI